MKRRDFSLATLGTAAAVGSLGLNTAALAQGPAKFVAGKDYLKLATLWSPPLRNG